MLSFIQGGAPASFPSHKQEDFALDLLADQAETHPLNVEALVIGVGLGAP